MYFYNKAFVIYVFAAYAQIIRVGVNFVKVLLLCDYYTSVHLTYTYLLRIHCIRLVQAAHHCLKCYTNLINDKIMLCLPLIFSTLSFFMSIVRGCFLPDGFSLFFLRCCCCSIVILVFVLHQHYIPAIYGKPLCDSIASFRHRNMSPLE